MSELKALWKLAFPIVISQIGFVSMGLVDTLIVGPMGPEALSAMSLGNTFFFGILICIVRRKAMEYAVRAEMARRGEATEATKGEARYNAHIVN